MANEQGRQLSEEDADAVDALNEEGYDTSDVGRGNKAMKPKDVGEETDVSSNEASRAAHQARDDMAEAGDMDVPADRHDK